MKVSHRRVSPVVGISAAPIPAIVDGSTAASDPGANALASAAQLARDPHLDLLRAAAIAMVVIYHVANMSPVDLGSTTRFVKWGQYGVDLFFVLSGWLIGGLFWRELAKFGGVKLFSFWIRRWLRTIPPYLAALALSWAAVYADRREAFDPSYLAFVQNYYREIPFFLVSWSLCIEEHFYVFLPLLVCALLWKQIRMRWFFLLLPLLSPVLRCLISPNRLLTAPFGYVETATHFRLEGLLLGFGAAYLPVLAPGRWAALKRAGRWLLVPSLVLLAALPLLTKLWMYRIGLTGLALAYLGILIYLAGGRPCDWPVRQRPRRLRLLHTASI